MAIQTMKEKVKCALQKTAGDPRKSPYSVTGASPVSNHRGLCALLVDFNLQMSPAGRY
jgi:hypothetical protein